MSKETATNSPSLSDENKSAIRAKINKEMKIFTWFQYKKGAGSLMPILKHALIPIDIYLLRYAVGEGAAAHTDDISKKMYRLNFVFNLFSKGGQFYGNTIFQFLNIYFFRADTEVHGVRPVEKGMRYVFSIGFRI